MFLNENQLLKIKKLINEGNEVSIMCTQSNLNESGAGDYNVIWDVTISNDNDIRKALSQYAHECYDVAINCDKFFLKKPHGYIQSILMLKIIDASNNIIFDDDNIIDVDVYFY